MRAPVTGVLPLGRGRRLRSELSLPKCLTVVESLLVTLRPPTYPHLPPFAHPGWIWNGQPSEAPATVISLFDEQDVFQLLAFWSDPGGTTCALIPIREGRRRLASLPLIDRWGQEDGTLTSIETTPPGLIALRAPTLATTYYESVLVAAGAPVTAHSLDAVARQLHEMFLTKAWEFIASQDRELAESFVVSHACQARGRLAASQAVLDDLAAWDRDVLPYIQALPDRCRAILLQDATDPSDPFWSELDDR